MKTTIRDIATGIIRKENLYHKNLLQLLPEEIQNIELTPESYTEWNTVVNSIEKILYEELMNKLKRMLEEKGMIDKTEYYESYTLVMSKTIPIGSLPIGQVTLIKQIRFLFEMLERIYEI